MNITLSDRVLRQLNEVRDRSEKLLAAFQTQEDWTHQVVAGTNHALWFAGHMAACDNWLIGSIAPEQAKPMDDWYKLFGTGSQPTSDPHDYPPPAEVVEAMRERRAELIKLLQSLSEERMAAPAPETLTDWCPDIGSIFEGAIWHEALHAGQVTVIRRALGHEPLFSGDPTDES